MSVIYNDFAGFRVMGQDCRNKKCWFYGIDRHIFAGDAESVEDGK